ncbi:MAG TPA: acyl carrier protein [Candidatus Polarisedimenticolaceae bacterium]|nr:acyl carrier protein [Candidatus Polarisedimenticolaceae bacterium]
MTEEEMVRAFITKNFLFSDDGRLGDEDSLMDKGVLDSTGVLEFVGFLESTYGLKVLDEELVPDNLDSIRSAAAFVRRKLQGRATVSGA